MTDRQGYTFATSVPKDPARFGVKSRHNSLTMSTTSLTDCEQLPNDSSPLSMEEVKDLVKILDKVCLPP